MKIGAMFESKYLKKEDVGNGITLTIRDIGIENVAMDNAPEDNKPVMYFHELKKGMVLNKTNANLLVHYLGSDDTQAWIGKQVILFDDPSVQFKGELTGGIRVRPVQLTQGQAVPQTPVQAPSVSTSEVPSGVQRPAPPPSQAEPYTQNPAFDDDIPI